MRNNMRCPNGRYRCCFAWGVTSALVLICGASATHGAVVDIELVALSAPGGSDVVPMLPISESAVAAGSTFFVEVWTQTTHANGLASVSFDMAFDSTLATGVGVTHTALFFELQNGTIDNPSGLVNDVSGSHLGPCTDEVGVPPNWARVAVIEMSALGGGTLVVQSASTGSAAFGTAICAVGDVDPADASFGGTSLQIIDGDIPAVTEWGLLVMGLLVLVAGTLVISRAGNAYPHLRRMR